MGDWISYTKFSLCDGLMHAARKILSIKSGEGEKKVNEDLNDKWVGGIAGSPATEVKLHFSYEAEGGYKVKVENWDRTSSYTVSSDDLVDNVLPLAPYSAHYTVYGTFTTVRDTSYEVEFYFDVEL